MEHGQSEGHALQSVSPARPALPSPPIFREFNGGARLRVSALRTLYASPALCPSDPQDKSPCLPAALAVFKAAKCMQSSFAPAGASTPDFEWSEACSCPGGYFDSSGAGSSARCVGERACFRGSTRTTARPPPA